MSNEQVPQGTKVDSGTGRPVAEGATMWGLIEQRAEQTPDLPMMYDEQGRSITFGEFRAQSLSVAAGLHQMGIAATSPVTWQLPTRIETLLVSGALARLGVRQNPVIHLYREREVGHLLSTTGATHYIVQGTWRGFDYADMGRRLAEQHGLQFDIVAIDEGLPDGDPATLPAPPSPDVATAVRWIYTTSGTTAAPKCVQHTDAGLIAGGFALSKSSDISSDDVGMIAFPFAHIGGPLQLVMMLRHAMPVVLMEAFVPDQAVALINRYQVTVAGGSTAFYLAFLNAQRAHGDERLMPSLRTLSGGGAPKPPEVFWAVREVLGIRVQHGYGMTECPMMANGSSADTDEQLANTDGAAVTGCEIKIIDADDHEVSTGADGEIVVRGPMLTVGYTDPAANDAAFLTDGFFRTGDRGHLRPDGHIVITGRTKELIIRKGENISPRELEDVLAAHPSVGAIAVIGLPDAERGERVCAVVETTPGADPLTFDEMVRSCLDAGIMKQKIPEQLEIVEALPRNPTMKILKTELITRYAAP